MVVETFSSLDVAGKTGATLRQLQWWDEHGFIKAKRGGRNRRQYTEGQVKQIAKLMNLRREYQLPLSYSLELLDADRVRVVTEPTMVGGTLVIPRMRS